MRASLGATAPPAAGVDRPQFVKDEFNAFVECHILAQGFLRLRFGECGHDKRIAGCIARGFRQLLAVIGHSTNAALIYLHRACGFTLPVIFEALA